MSINGSGTLWFGIRCVFHNNDEPNSYEERVTLWHAPSFDDAVAMAEEEAEEYAEATELTYLGFAQAYVLPETPGHGAEVFSLIRDSELSPDDYLDSFFDTGDEREASLDD